VRWAQILQAAEREAFEAYVAAGKHRSRGPEEDTTSKSRHDSFASLYPELEDVHGLQNERQERQSWLQFQGSSAPSRAADDTGGGGLFSFMSGRTASSPMPTGDGTRNWLSSRELYSREDWEQESLRSDQPLLFEDSSYLSPPAPHTGHSNGRTASYAYSRSEGGMEREVGLGSQHRRGEGGGDVSPRGGNTSPCRDRLSRKGYGHEGVSHTGSVHGGEASPEHGMSNYDDYNSNPRSPSGPRGAAKPPLVPKLNLASAGKTRAPVLCGSAVHGGGADMVGGVRMGMGASVLLPSST
jgi:hypothetical protein